MNTTLNVAILVSAILMPFAIILVLIAHNRILRNLGVESDKVKE